MAPRDPPHASEADLARLLFEHGQEPRARAVARAIVRGRPYSSVEALACLTTPSPTAGTPL